MRIDKLVVNNFKGFEIKEFQFSQQFNLVVGTNGTGKTSALDALAVALGSWFLGIRGYEKNRHIRSEEIRLAPRKYDGEIRFEDQYPVSIAATGQIADKTYNWSRSLNSAKGRTTFGDATNIRDVARAAEKDARAGNDITLPLISYYGTGRLWLAPRQDTKVTSEKKLSERTKLSRLEGYRNSIDPRLSVRDLVTWIARQSWISYQQGKEESVFKSVKKAILGCVEDAENLYFDPKRGEVVVVMREHGAQPFANLSDGQRCMLAMVGDIAQKAAKLNPQFGDKVLAKTPGVVLIDELDLHLHPRWQRRVIADLRRTFPKIQFICTTHSPQLIGQVKSDEVILLDESGSDHPPQSYGMDSNWILRHIMKGDDRDPEIAKALDEIFEHIDKARFEQAQAALTALRTKIGEHPELVEAQALIGRYTRFDSSAAE
ncbi:MAG: AAA family ATPase [Betaproteobacteria bacterium]